MRRIASPSPRFVPSADGTRIVENSAHGRQLAMPSEVCRLANGARELLEALRRMARDTDGNKQCPYCGERAVENGVYLRLSQVDHAEGCDWAFARAAIAKTEVR